jgi:hypothetical protein
LLSKEYTKLSENFIRSEDTMKMVLTENGWVQKKENIIEEMRQTLPLSTSYIVDMPRIKESIKNMEFTKGKTMSVGIGAMALGVAGATVDGGAGIFWKTFMTYIFPYLMDIAKVYCAIQIARAFYEERRGGRDSGTGIGAFVTYGKWYLLFALTPWAVELVDQLGGKMLTELRGGM